MRDIILTLLVFGSLPFILRNPYVGVLVWSWLSYMSPHKLTWGFASSMPYAQIVALTLFASLLFSKDKKSIPVCSLTVIWALFLLWMIVTSISAFYPNDAYIQLVKIFKIQLIVFLTIMLINDQKRIDQLIWVIVISIGFFSVKGGIFTILSGGLYRVWGPPGGFIAENNALAVATLMIIPLMIYLYNIVDRKWGKYVLVISIILSLISVVGSQSRGALIAILATGVFFWLKSNSKLLIGAFIIVVASAGFTLMPQNWHERMNTISEYKQDASAMSRINSWKYSINVANSHLTGAGLESWQAEAFAIYAPNPDSVYAAHSIYFSILADHGWPGFLMFLLILVQFWRYLSQTIKSTKNQPAYSNQNILARMLQVTIIAYMAGGAFLSLAYFDLPWHIIAISVLLRKITMVPRDPTHTNRTTRITSRPQDDARPGLL